MDFTSILNGLNQGVGNLTGTPLGQLGINLLMASGPQQGNPGGGARLGMALGGMQEMQRAQQLQAYRQAQIQQAQRQQQEAEAQRQQQAALREQFKNPDFLATLTPLARQYAQAGASPEQVIKAQNSGTLDAYRQQSLEQQQSQFDVRQQRTGASHGGGPSGPKMPTPRMILDEPLGNDMYQRHRFDDSTGDYVPYGKPFSKHAPHSNAKNLNAITDELTPAPATQGQPDLSALPGNAPLSSYAPQQSAPAPMIFANGSNPHARQTPVQQAAQGPATPKTKADYDRLPSGAQYIDPASGRVATKR